MRELERSCAKLWPTCTPRRRLHSSTNAPS